MKISTARVCVWLRRAWRWLCGRWKKILGVCFKLAIVLIGIGAADVIGVIAYEEWDNRYGTRGGRYINEEYGIYARYFADDRVRLMNMKTEKYLTRKLLWVGEEPPRDSISVYSDCNHLRGFYNTHTGRITLPARYRHAWYFSEGIAAVVNDYGRVKFIRYDGSEAVPGSYHYSKGYDYVFKDGLCQMYNDSTGCIGLLRTDGTWALPQEYYFISDSYADGVRIVNSEKGWQLLTADFTPAFDGYYESMTMADEAKGVYVFRDYLKQLLAFDGTVLLPLVIDGTYPLKFMTKYNSDVADEYEIIPEVVVYRVNGWEGLMDKRSGRILTPAIYHNFSLISPTLIQGELEYCDDDSVVLDLKGNLVHTR